MSESAEGSELPLESDEPDIISISIEDDRDRFCAGDYISGQLRVELEKPSLVASVNVIFSGMARVNFEKFCDKEAGREYYSNSQVLCREKYVIWQAEDGKELVVGMNQIPFSVLVPPRLPPSFKILDRNPITEAYEGRLYYSLRVVLEVRTLGERPVARGEPTHEEIEKEMEICIRPSLDLSACPVYANSFRHVTYCRGYGVLCLPEGKIIIDLRTPKYGFIPGELIGLEGFIENRSCFTAVKKVKMELKRTTHFTGWRCSGTVVARKQQKRRVLPIRSHRTIRTVVAQSEYTNEIKPGELRRWTGEHLEGIVVPSKAVGTFGERNCIVVQVDFALIVRVILTGIITRVQELNFPIIVGGTPLIIDKPKEKVTGKTKTFKKP